MLPNTFTGLAADQSSTQDLELTIAVIERSNRALERALRSHAKIYMDLSGAYITDDLTKSHLLLLHNVKIDCDGTFMELRFFRRDPSFGQELRFLSERCPRALTSEFLSREVPVQLKTLDHLLKTMSSY
jgi:hypothetical protein